MRNGSLLSAILTTTLAVFLTGCSRNPVAPNIEPSGQPGTGTTVVGIVPDDPPPVSGGTPILRTVTLLPTDEVDIVVGRFTLSVRKNTLKMPATITLRVDNPEAMDVHMQITPAEANSFQSPAILTANLSDVQDFDYSTGWMDDWNGDWTPMTDVSSHPNQQNVVAHLMQVYDCMVSNDAGKKTKLGA